MQGPYLLVVTVGTTTAAAMAVLRGMAGAAETGFVVPLSMALSMALLMHRSLPLRFMQS